jgi:hypothetical protein
MAKKSLAVWILFSAIAASLGAQGLPPAEQYHIRGEYSWWWPKLGADLQKGDNGTVTNATEDLGATDDRTYIIAATLRAGASHKLSGTYTKLDYTGDVTQHSTIRYDNQTFFDGTRVVSSLKGAYYGGQYEYDFAKGQQGYVGALLGARVLDLDVVLVAPVEARRALESVSVVRPILGVTARGYVGSRVSIGGTFGGMTVGSRGYVLEFEATAQLHLFERIAIKGGYRSFKVKDLQGTSLLQFRDEGGTLGLELSL